MLAERPGNFLRLLFLMIIILLLFNVHPFWYDLVFHLQLELFNYFTTNPIILQSHSQLLLVPALIFIFILHYTAYHIHKVNGFRIVRQLTTGFPLFVIVWRKGNKKYFIILTSGTWKNVVIDYLICDLPQSRIKIILDLVLRPTIPINPNFYYLFSIWLLMSFHLLPTLLCS